MAEGVGQPAKQAWRGPGSLVESHPAPGRTTHDELPDVVAAGSKVRAFDLPGEEDVITTFAVALPKGLGAGASRLAQYVVADLVGGPASQALVSSSYLLP